MTLQLSPTTEAALREKAFAAGFSSVEEFLSDLVAPPRRQAKLSLDEAMEELRRLRKTTPRMTTEEVVAMIREDRDR
jgi:hypothetical protein